MHRDVADGHAVDRALCVWGHGCLRWDCRVLEHAGAQVVPSGMPSALQAACCTLCACQMWNHPCSQPHQRVPFVPVSSAHMQTGSVFAGAAGVQVQHVIQMNTSQMQAVPGTGRDMAQHRMPAGARQVCGSRSPSRQRAASPAAGMQRPGGRLPLRSGPCSSHCCPCGDLCSGTQVSD